ncbi:hypothetical protein [Mycoplasmopsis agassizii]|uniref:DUF4234 domain-containing protein n=1 Tax=Mycoplasmopsis agassizii TaxID=33922 RepID=A0ABX4H4Z8_9BACT|nr:hypothetical protein [Mycoplasmopsis agassizii]PAF54950.1 hypothetical protein CJF60_04405 [Mycoplasmopsis agassizii]SMC17012.1 hypothetical protein SAMN02745179_00371 [Mycoplasmopsis agassizii]
MQTTEALQVAANQKFYLLFIPVYIGVNILFYIWYWILFIKRNEKLIPKKTGLTDAFLNYAKDATYKRHLLFFSLMSIALNIYLVIISILVVYNEISFFTDAVDFEATTIKLNLYINVGILVPILLAISIIFIALFALTSHLLYKKDKKSEEITNYDFEVLKKFCDYHKEVLNRWDSFENLKNPFDALYLVCLFIWIFWLPSIYAPSKIKRILEKIKEIKNQQISDEEKRKLIAYNLSLATNYLWYGYIFYLNSFKINKLKTYLSILIREAEQDGFTLEPTS